MILSSIDGLSSMEWEAVVCSVGQALVAIRRVCNSIPATCTSQTDSATGPYFGLQSLHKLAVLSPVLFAHYVGMSSPQGNYSVWDIMR